MFKPRLIDASLGLLEGNGALVVGGDEPVNDFVHFPELGEAGSLERSAGDEDGIIKWDVWLLTFNQGVRGSNPRRLTRFGKVPKFQHPLRTLASGPPQQATCAENT